MAISSVAEVTGFQAARERWDRARSARRELLDRLETGRAALRLHGYSFAEHEPRPITLIEKVEQFKVSLGRRRLEHEDIARVVRLLEREVAEGTDDFADEQQRWQNALGAEQSRRTSAVLPELKASASRVGKLVEELSLEIERARSLTAPVAEVGAAALDIGAEFGTLAEYNSAVSAWNRRMLREELL